LVEDVLAAGVLGGRCEGEHVGFTGRVSTHSRMHG
jgi:hypothetical protein